MKLVGSIAMRLCVKLTAAEDVAIPVECAAVADLVPAVVGAVASTN
jgi:hypothetical protein